MNKQQLRAVPVLGAALAGAARVVRRQTFPGSKLYWEQRYARGGTSGAGSAGTLAQFKADTLNAFVADHAIDSVIEFGCGDGQQLALAKYPSYLGLDVSATTVRNTMNQFADDPTKSFMLYDPWHFADPAGMVRADLTISLDVIYHLVEDEVYELHLRHVFGAARQFVVLYTSDADTVVAVGSTPPHVRHRPVIRDVARNHPDWRLREHIPNRHTASFADFLIYERA